MKNQHLLKIERCFLQALVDWRKTHEIRLNDRDYQTWDLLVFDEEILWDWFIAIPKEVVGRSIIFEITHILNSTQFSEWLKENYVILSLKKIK